MLKLAKVIFISKSVDNTLVYRANVDIYIELLKNFGISKNDDSGFDSRRIDTN